MTCCGMLLLILSTVIFSHLFLHVASIERANCSLESIKNTLECSRSSIVLSIIISAKNLLDEAEKYAVKTSCSAIESHRGKPMDCADIHEKDSLVTSGVYKIWPRSRMSSGPLSVYCDMDDDGGGWTVIQKRGNFDSPKDYFYKDWVAYKKGFGDLLRDFWLGNDNIFAVTNQKNNRVKFSLSDWEGNKTYAVYDEFWIDDELHKYTMHVSGYRGTAGDSFSTTNEIPFSTKEQDNDSSQEVNCAVTYKGAWWYTGCHSSNLNGQYLKGPHETYADGVNWYSLRGHHYSLKDTAMKIRPKDFKGVSTVITPH